MRSIKWAWIVAISVSVLEVLDPEQNHTFNDHYLEVDFDLSEVMLLHLKLNEYAGSTAGSNGNHSDPRLYGRRKAEHRNYLVPKQIKNNGLGSSEIEIPDSTLTDLIRYYTQEAGVRGLDREISKLARKVVRKQVRMVTKIGGNDEDTVVVTPDVSKIIRVLEFTYGLRKPKIGLVKLPD